MPVLPQAAPDRTPASAWLLLAAACAAGLAGCASPGHPLPPSLNIPRAPTGLTAIRVGDEVRLHWTTPARTTDGVPIRGELTAEICRTTASVGDGPRPTSANQPACHAVGHTTVRPGPSDAIDPLPTELNSGAPALLVYQVQLRGQSGKTSPQSPPAYAAGGPAPAPFSGLRESDTPAGAVLEWQSDPAASPEESVEILRHEDAPPATAPHSESRVSPPPPEGHANPKPARPTSPLLDRSSPAGPARFTSGPGDPGGVIDRLVTLGHTYTYTVQRVRTVTLDGHSLELRSPVSAPLVVAIRDIFPPATPGGLLAAPGGRPQTDSEHPSSAVPVDLSWEPNPELPGVPPVIGYRVYRADDTAPQFHLLTPEPIPTPAFQDATPQPGHTYRYRVTAVGATGKESAPSPELVQPT